MLKVGKPSMESHPEVSSMNITTQEMDFLCSYQKQSHVPNIDVWWMTPSGTNLGHRPARSECVGLYCIPVSDSCDTFSHDYSQGSGLIQNRPVWEVQSYHKIKYLHLSSLHPLPNIPVIRIQISHRKRALGTIQSAQTWSVLRRSP